MTNPSFDVCEISFMLNLLNNRKHNATLKKNVIMVIRILRTFLKVANLNQRVIGIIMSDRFLIYNLFDTKDSRVRERPHVRACFSTDNY